jgi:UDPglucose 6-dehydrogenase
VGQATGIGFNSNGNHVTFNDIDKEKLLQLSKKGFTVNEDLEDTVNNADVTFVCVPTPTVRQRIDYSYINECTKEIATALKKIQRYSVITYRSTIPPQTTRTKLIPLLERFSGLQAGRDFGVCMNPEFLREKSAIDDFRNPSRIVVGALDKKSGSVLKRVYSNFSCPVVLTTLDTAEMIKYTSNTFLAAKISFFNEIYFICQKLGLDSKAVTEAVALDPRIGAYGIDGGKPFGGFCLPKDLAAFIHFTKLKGYNPKILKAVAKVNREIGQQCAQEDEYKLEIPQTCLS